MLRKINAKSDISLLIKCSILFLNTCNRIFLNNDNFAIMNPSYICQTKHFFFISIHIKIVDFNVTYFTNLIYIIVELAYCRFECTSSCF